MTPASEITGRLSKALSDRYRVERELGVGGMATVFLAHDLKHERDVALKVLHPELAAVLGAERFLAEIKVTAKLQHPHILPLLDSGEADGLLFYVMPVVDGEALRAKLQRETQLPVDDAVRITKEVGSALDYAHRHGVIHRDIKPENILLHDGRAVVTDFGIALAVTAAGGARLTQTGLSLGTPQYMAPEQAMGEKAVDARADVYALGCVLYEMLAGQAPFTGPTAQAIVAQVLTTDALPVTTHRKTVPRNVARAVHMALQKLPADRFATIAEFTAALDGSVIMPAATGELAVPRASRGVSWGMIAAGVAVGAAIGVGLMSSGDSGLTSQEPRYYQIALPDTAPFIAGANRLDVPLKSVAISRDGRSVAYVAATPGAQRIALVRLDRGTVTVLRGTEGGYLPAFSPDGRSIAFAVDRQIKRMSVDDVTATVIGSTSYPFSIAWGSAGFIYVTGFGSGAPTCAIAIPEAGGQHRAVEQFSCSAIPSIAPLSAGTAHAVAADGNGNVQLVDLDRGSRREVLEVDGTPWRGVSPFLLGLERLVFARDSSLYAVAIDAATGQTNGQSVNVLTGVLREAWSGGAHFDASTDGTIVWAPGGDASRGAFVWVNDRGVVIDTAHVPQLVVASYALSPDAKRIAYSALDQSGKSRLLVANLQRRVTDEVPFAEQLDPFNWVHEGGALTATLVRPGQRARYAVIDFAGSAPRVDTVAVFEDESRDGKMRCVATDSGRVLTRGAERTRLPREVANWCRFSPDGSRMLYNNNSEMGVILTSGRTAESRVAIAPAGADEGRWSEDGRTIYYRNANGWYAVDAPQAADMRPRGSPRLLFTGRFLQAQASWDRSRDGRFLLLQGPPSPRLQFLNVMTNFRTLVDEKLKAAK
jgi:hypothetical protein